MESRRVLNGVVINRLYIKILKIIMQHSSIMNIILHMIKFSTIY